MTASNSTDNWKWHPALLLSVVAGILVVLAVAVVVSLHVVQEGQSAARGGCAHSVPGGGVPGAQPSKTAAALKLQEGQRLQVDFGRSKNARTLTVLLSAGGPISRPTVPLHTRIDIFRRDDDARINQQDVVITQSEVSARTVSLSLCFGRMNNHLGDPGSYQGSITVDDSRLANPVVVPVTVTMQYVHGMVLLWLLLLAIVPGSWVLWVVHTRRQPVQPGLDFTSWVQWLLSVGGVVAVGTGSVAAFGVYTATYLRNPTWGSSVLQPLTLYGAMFSAFVTSAGITQLARLGRVDDAPTADDNARTAG